MSVSLRVVALVLLVLAADVVLEGWRLRRRARRPMRTRDLRTARRLDNARIDCSPARWRRCQVLGALPLWPLLVLGGLSVLMAALSALSVARTLASAVLWVRRDWLRSELECCAALVARCIGSEMRNGLGAGGAIGAAADGGVAIARPELRAILHEAKSRVALGSTAAEALAISLGTAQSRLSRELPVLAMVAAALAAQLRGGSADRESMRRLADILDGERRGRERARASLTETRVAGFAVPAVTAVVAATVIGSNRGAAAVMATVPGLLAVTGFALMGGCGLALVARMTR